MGWVPNETLDAYEDDGTMVNNAADLASVVIGHRITSVERVGGNLELTLDNGISVLLRSSSDCCAYTELRSFILHADKVDHIITGMRTEDGYHVWNIFADMGDVLQLQVDWSCGNPFYYGYGFEIVVTDKRAEAYTAGKLPHEDASRFIVDTATS